MGSDLGAALKGFKKAVNEDDPVDKKDADFDAVEDKKPQSVTNDDVLNEQKEKVKD